jgi:hypothetical protein
MAITWTPTFSDGDVLTHTNLNYIKSDLDSQAMTLAVTQTVTGNKTFSGTNVHSGTNTHSGTETFTGSVSFTNKSVITCLSTTASVNMVAGAGPTTLYTVPAGKTAIITHVVIRTISASLAGGVDFDFTGWRQTVDLSSITSAYATSYICLDCNNAVYTPAVAASTFQITNSTGSTGAATCTIDVWGYTF